MQLLVVLVWSRCALRESTLRQCPSNTKSGVMKTGTSGSPGHPVANLPARPDRNRVGNPTDWARGRRQHGPKLKLPSLSNSEGGSGGTSAPSVAPVQDQDAASEPRKRTFLALPPQRARSRTRPRTAHESRRRVPTQRPTRAGNSISRHLEPSLGHLNPWLGRSRPPSPPRCRSSPLNLAILDLGPGLPRLAVGRTRLPLRDPALTFPGEKAAG
jgi:hypothetical protein